MSSVNNDDRTISELMTELDQIVNWFHGDDVNIELATEKFDEGVKIVETIKEKLADSENKINQIKLRLNSVNDD